MRLTGSFAALTFACALVAPAAPPAEAAEEPAGIDGALAAARPVVAAARKAPKGDAETAKALKAARAALEPFAAAVRTSHWDESKGAKNAAFATVWNQLMTVGAFHGVPGRPVYVLDRSEILWARYHFGLPTGGAWSWNHNVDPKTSDQLRLITDQKRPNGKPLRKIKVWTYRWDTVYSGVGGENYKGLAKMMQESDRDSMAKAGRKSSGAITPKRVNAEFDRVYYYFVEGFDVDEEQRLRRDNYYMKGSNLSFNFEVITYLDPTEGDDAVTKWQCGEGDPEIAAVLESLVSNPAHKSAK